MIEIKKKNPPKVLLDKQREASEKKLSPQESYKLLKKDRFAKKNVENSLIVEQGGLCAYCMRRIPEKTTFKNGKWTEIVRIEHWTPRSLPNVGQGLDYNCLLAVCSGNEGKKTEKHNKDSALTCDAKRGARPLKVNPCDPSTLRGIQYSSNGTISSIDPEIDTDLNVCLGLNCSVDVLNLPNLRKGALNGLLKVLKTPLESKSTEEFRKYCAYVLAKLENDEGVKMPYVGVVIWKLKEILLNTKE